MLAGAGVLLLSYANMTQIKIQTIIIIGLSSVNIQYGFTLKLPDFGDGTDRAGTVDGAFITICI